MTSKAGSPTPADRRLEVARRYYLQDESKVAIAKALGLSRFQVARMLDEARRDGIVRIEIGVPGGIDEEASAELEKALGIRRVLVVTGDSASQTATVDHLGAVLARELAHVVPEGAVVGMTWSRPIVAMSQRLAGLHPCTVVQLAGAVYPPPGMPGSVEVARRVAQAAGGQAHALYTPLVVPDSATAAGLRRQPEVAEVLGLAHTLDIAVLSVGAWQASASAVYDLLDDQERSELAAAGVCGEISGRLMDRAGAPMPTTLDTRVIGVELSTLRHVPHLITTSHGAYRAEATRAAISAGLVHTLIVDDSLAAALIN